MNTEKGILKKVNHWKNKYIIGNYEIKTDNVGGLCECIYNINIRNLINNYQKSYTYEWECSARKNLYKLIKYLRNGGIL